MYGMTTTALHVFGSGIVVGWTDCCQFLFTSPVVYLFCLGLLRPDSTLYPYLVGRFGLKCPNPCHLACQWVVGVKFKVVI